MAKNKLKNSKKIKKESQKKQNKKSRDGQFPEIEDTENKNIKMSEVLVKFIEPYMEWAIDEDKYRTLLAVAILAWNLAFFADKNEREKTISQFLTSFSVEDRESIRYILEVFIDRKRQHFFQYHRRIYNFNLSQIESGYHIEVTSVEV